MTEQQKQTMNTINKHGNTPFYLAAHYGDETTVRQCIELGIDLNQRNSNGWTPLMSAAQEGHSSVVKLLLDAGADVNLQNNYYMDTALIRASSYGYIDIMKMLIDAGADVNISGKYTGSALTSIRFEDNATHNLTAVKLLIEAGANINHKSGDGNTCLIYASRAGCYDVVNYLLEHGADETIQNTYNHCAVDATYSPKIRAILRGFKQHSRNITYALCTGPSQLDADVISVIGAFAGFQNVYGQKSLRNMVLSVQELSASKAECPANTAMLSAK